MAMGTIPVTLITGYLGSGKTTLVRALLRHPGMSSTAVIVNEFGEIGLDHELIEHSTEQTTLLPNGCLCCEVRTDLQETLRSLFIRRRAGEVPDFERVFIETSGLADPLPILRSIQSDNLLASQYRLDCVLTTVDVVNAEANLDSAPEAVHQVGAADRILITKSDLAAAARHNVVQERIASINPFCGVRTSINGDVDLSFVTNVAPSGQRAAPERVDRWLSFTSLSDSPSYLGHRLGGPGRHDRSIRSFSMFFDKPFSRETYLAALNTLAMLRGKDLLRVKGLLNVEGEPGPVLVQGAQHAFHPPESLASWSSDDHRSRLVFITRNVSRASIESLFLGIQAVCSSA